MRTECPPRSSASSQVNTTGTRDRPPACRGTDTRSALALRPFFEGPTNSRHKSFCAGDRTPRTLSTNSCVSCSGWAGMPGNSSTSTYSARSACSFATSKSRGRAPRSAKCHEGGLRRLPLHELGQRPLRLEGHRLLGEQQAPILPRSPNLIELAKFSRQAAKRSAATSKAQILVANHAVPSSPWAS